MLVGVQLEVGSSGHARIHVQVLIVLGMLTDVPVKGSALVLPSAPASRGSRLPVDVGLDLHLGLRLILDLYLSST